MIFFIKRSFLFFLISGILPCFIVSIQAAEISEQKAIHVRDFMRNAGHYTGIVDVKGVVSRVVSDQNMLALIDLAEYGECNVVTCAQLILPVYWEGKMPKIKQKVRITGQVRMQGTNRIFHADSIIYIKD